MSPTKAITIYLLVMAALAAFFLIRAPIADWLKWTIGAGVAGSIIAIIALHIWHQYTHYLDVMDAIQDGE